MPLIDGGSSHDAYHLRQGFKMSTYKKQVLIHDRYIHNTYEVRTSSRPVNAYPSTFGMNASVVLSSYQYSQSRGRQLSSSEYERSYDLPLSELPSIISELNDARDNNQADGTTALLCKEFILAASGHAYKESNFHTNTTSEVHGHYYTYQDYTVRPTIEALLLQNPGRFAALLDADQTPENKEAYLKSMQLIQLTDENEEINFSYFDLTGASFKGAKLAKSTLYNAKKNNVDFSASDLSLTDITQAQLDSALTYHNASLPLHLWKYWDEGIKQDLLGKFEELKKYADDHIKKDDIKYVKVMSLYDKYQPILAREGNISTADKKAMLNDLTSAETTNAFSKHRDLKTIVAEIASVFALLVIGYLILAGIKKRQTGHFGLFTETKTSAMTRSAKELVQATGPSV